MHISSNAHVDLLAWTDTTIEMKLSKRHFIAGVLFERMIND